MRGMRMKLPTYPKLIWLNATLLIKRISALEQKLITIHKKRGNLAMQICVQTTNCMITSKNYISLHVVMPCLWETTLCLILLVIFKESMESFSF